MPQLYETERKVIYRHSDTHYELYELWHYVSRFSWASSKTEIKDGYICGRLSNDGIEFRGEEQILQENIVGYLDENLQFWNTYINLQEEIKRLKIEPRFLRISEIDEDTLSDIKNAEYGKMSD